jgi:hypothetical protein
MGRGKNTWAEYEGSSTKWNNDQTNYEVSSGQAHDEHIRHLQQ